jgi:D-alanyl-D-alanine carboxypeptidase
MPDPRLDRERSLASSEWTKARRSVRPGSMRRAAMLALAAALALVTGGQLGAEARTAANAKEVHKKKEAPANAKELHKRNEAPVNAKEAQKKKKPHRVGHGPSYQPPYADFVIDDNSGQVLHETNCDSPRHPASLTKVMTLYLLFEQLRAKKLNLDSPLAISATAASQAPTKLGLKANETITVEDAIKGIVTRSANDAAVAVAEALAGSQSDFAVLMTRKAQALGMAGTVYVNASGLPADAQITTARDQAVLGRAIQEHFPEYYRYFAIPNFQYRRAVISNHNALLRQMEGVDGIKTGYTEASGYNLLSSLRRAGRHLVAVVLGGRSNGARDARMRQLLEENIQHAAEQRTAPPILEAAEPVPVLQPVKAALPLPPADSVLPANAAPAMHSAAPAQPAQPTAPASLEHIP